MAINRSFRKKAGVITIILLLILAGMQFVRPSLDNPPVTADFAAPEPVKEIIKRACYDCHSNETRLAWFDQPVPAYWMVVSDVEEGRKALNFSHWDSLPKEQRAGKLFEALNQIEFKTMPLKQYVWFHHGARITGDDIAVLRKYFYSLAPALTPDTAKISAADAQYEKWVQAAGTRLAGAGGPANAQTAGAKLPVAGERAGVPGVQPALNGIAYIPGYSNWKAISTTERFDNGTMRVIFGNDVAITAIREGHTHPWPNGATFAKVAWDQVIDSAGEVRPGAFKQVEFMIRDNDKYAGTDGWGWGRWRGMQLTPYGKNAGFTTECVNCHKPMQDNDHVFTIPIADTLRLFDEAASLPDSLAGRLLAGKVISSFVNTRERTMSVLYGNDIAVNSARSGATILPAGAGRALHDNVVKIGGAYLSYPVGAVLSLVTWSQRDDPHWFGGRIPESIRSVEQIVFETAGGVSSPSYKKFEGMPLKNEGTSLKKSDDAGPETIQDRILYIMSRRASVMP